MKMNKTKWKKIAGRGKLGDMNWGADFDRPLSIVKNELRELQKHIGEQILLTGGGSLEANLAVLKKAYITEPEPKKFAVQVKLTDLEPSLGYRDTFTPYIDSWQISVQV